MPWIDAPEVFEVDGAAEDEVAELVVDMEEEGVDEEPDEMAGEAADGEEAAELLLVLDAVIESLEISTP